MEYRFYYGTYKIPFSLQEGEVKTPDDSSPFHGIISRGLMNKMAEQELGIETWHRYGHLIHENAAPEEREWNLLRELAKQEGVLSFAQSATSAMQYIEEYYPFLSDEKRICELWNIKEGHTSSVWKTAVLKNNGQRTDLFALNVSRDREAGIELKNISEKIQLIKRQFSEVSIAAVFDIEIIVLKMYNEDVPVVVTRNQFVGEAQEIHLLKNKENQTDQYILVERFLTSEHLPSHISSIRGRKFTATESSSIQNVLHSFQKSIAPEFHTDIHINEGDLVWNGKEAVIVAIT